MLTALAVLFFKSFGIAFSGAAAPGPVLVVVISQTSRHGFWRGPLIIVGHSLLEIALVVALVLGLGPLLKIRLVAAIIALVGGVLLVVMATMMAWSIPRLRLNFEAADPPVRDQNPLLAGIVTSLSNPYWTLWWATIGLGLIAEARLTGLAGLTTFYVGHILGDFVWYAVIGFAIAVGRRFFNTTIYRTIIAVCAAALLFFGILFFAAGYRDLRATPSEAPTRTTTSLTERSNGD